MLVDPIVVPRGTVESEEVRRDRVGGLADGARQRRQVWESRAEARSKWEGKEMFAGWTRRALDLYLAEGLRDRSDGRVELKCSGEVEATIFESGSRSMWRSAIATARATSSDSGSRLAA